MIDLSKLFRRIPSQLGGVVVVASNGQRTSASLSVETVEEDGGGPMAVAVQREILTYAAGSLPTLARKDHLTVDGHSRAVIWDRAVDGNPMLRIAALEVK